MTETKPGSGDSSFLPNFCEPRMVLAVVLVSELLALIFSLVRTSDSGFLTDLASISVLMQWLGLTSAGLLCAMKPVLRRTSTALTTGAVLGLVLVNILVLSGLMVLAGRWLGGGTGLGLFPAEFGPFVLRNLIIGLIVTSLLLRYFFVSHQWRLHVQAEARSRIDALQARIRPHFLFNSMNTIASLTRSNPGQAEEAVEDLADLFRASLSDAGKMLTLKEEFELSRIYQRIEELRLGERLNVEWDIGQLPMRAQIPQLTLQPLLENAIYHGIEPLDSGGTVRIHGHVRDGQIQISVSNPTVAPGESDGHHGHQIAMQNIRERLRLAFDGRGTMDIEKGDHSYRVCLKFPAREA